MPVNVEAKIFVLSEVILAVFEFTVLVNVVILFVLDAILVSKVDMVDEFTPPMVLTVGDVAVPPRSPAN